MYKLDGLRLYGLRAGLTEQLTKVHYGELSFEDRLGLLVDAAWTASQSANFLRRLKAAHLHQEASLADLDIAPSRPAPSSPCRHFCVIYVHPATLASPDRHEAEAPTAFIGKCTLKPRFRKGA